MNNSIGDERSVTVSSFFLDPIVKHVSSQFSRPRGPLGSLAGRIMANRGSNVDRNIWLVGLLDLQPDFRVLEIGPGPGVALAMAAQRVVEGELVAIDHSSTMLRQARARIAAVGAQDRVRLIEGNAERLTIDGQFDRIFAMNVWQFWGEQEATIASLAAFLKPGGKLALGYQPRHRGATAGDGETSRKLLKAQFAQVGLEKAADLVLELDPPVSCVIGSRTTS